MRNPGAGPAYDPFPTKLGGAREADGGVNREAALPYFQLLPGIPGPPAWWQDQQPLQRPWPPPVHVS